MWNQNENMIDRIIRGVIGIALLAGAIFGLVGIWQWVVGLIGVILLATAITGICPGYKVLGIRTGGTDSSH
jgi:hypothetical protein